MGKKLRVVVTDVSKKISAPYYVAATPQLRTEREAAHEALLNEATRLQARLQRMRDIAAELDLVDELNAVIESVMVLSSRLRR